MRRGKRLILLAHCILNQNTVIRDWERAAGAYNDIVKILLERQLGIIQLPCPEFLWQGEGRPPGTKQEYDTEEYRCHCRKLAEGIADQTKEYLAQGYQIAELIGIQESPSCDTKTTRGIFSEELFCIFKRENINVNSIDVPTDYLEGSGGIFLEELKAWTERSDISDGRKV